MLIGVRGAGKGPGEGCREGVRGILREAVVEARGLSAVDAPDVETEAATDAAAELFVVDGLAMVPVLVLEVVDRGVASSSRTSRLSKSHATPCLTQLPHRGWTSSH